MKNKLLISLMFALLSFSTGYSANWYVNDGSTAGDVFCTAVGNNANSGSTPALPKLTLAAALTACANGDTIYIDTGIYTDKNRIITKSITIIGAGSTKAIFQNGTASTGCPGSSTNEPFLVIDVNNVSVSGLTATNYTGTFYDGSAIAVNGRTGIVFNDIALINNCGDTEPAFSVLANSSVTVNNSSFSCNRGNYGGGFNILGSGINVTFNDCSFSNNAALTNGKGAGGKIYGGTGTTVTINRCKFYGNLGEGSADGGALFIANGNGTTTNINNSCFENNVIQTNGSQYGGAICVGRGGGTVNISNCNFINNQVNNGGTGTGQGGAIAIHTGSGLSGGGVTVDVNTCTFNNNTATTRGKHIFVSENSSTRLVNATVTNCTFTTNTTPSITVVDGGTLNVSDSGSPTGTGFNLINSNTPTSTANTTCPTLSADSCRIAPSCTASLTYPNSNVCQSVTTDPAPTFSPAGGTFTSSAGLSINATTGIIDASASTAGNYVVTYTPSAADPTCTATFSITIVANPAITTQPATTQTVCQNATATAISVVATGATLSYQWYSNTTNSNVGGTLIATATSSSYTPPTSSVGTLYYYVVITNTTTTCFSTSNTSEVNVTALPTAPTASVTTQPTCATPTGTITVTAPANGAGVSYTVTGTNPIVAAQSNTTGVFSGLATGIYDVTVTVNGCTSLPTSLTVNSVPGLTGQEFFDFASAIRINNTIYNNTSANTPVVNGQPGFTATENEIQPGGLYFNGQNLGAYNPNSGLLNLTAGEIKTIKTTGNVCSATMHYRIYKVGDTPGSFTPISLTTVVDCTGDIDNNGTHDTYGDGFGPCRDNYQKWKDYTLNIDLTQRCVGNYKLEVYYTYTGSSCSASGCGETKTINNGGSNFIADFTINSIAPPTAAASQVFCSATNPTVANLTATGTAIQWYADATGGSPLASTTALVNGETYYATQTVSGCESDRTLVTVTITTTPAAPTATTPQVFCSATNPTVASLTATGTAIQWYADAIGGSPLASTTALVDGETYYATQTVSGCESDRTLVTVTITTTPAAPTATTPQVFCSGTNPTVANLTATGTAIQWYADATGGSPLATSTALVDGETYYATQTVSGCESDRTLVTVTITATPAAPTATTPQVFCSATNPTVASLTATGTAIQWYADATGGSPLASTTALVNGETYYATQTVSGCESDRTLVTVTITTTPAAPTATTPQVFCSATNPTVASLTATGTAIQWYADAIGGSPLASTTALVDGETYYATQTVSGCESDRTLVTVTITTTPAAPTATTPQVFCSGTNPTVANLTATGTAIQWYADATGGSPLATSTALVDGETYYATQTVSGCESDRTLVTVTITATPAAPTATTPQVFCSATNPTVASLTATGTAIQWYADATGGSPLASTTALVDGETYYATQTVSGCESDRTLVNVTIDPCSQPSIVLTKLSTYNDVNANGIVNAGDTITYNFTVVNTGNVTVSNIVINDPLLGVSNLAVSPATLAVGASGTASATYTITQADINAGSITNTATATGTAPDNSTVTDVSDNGDELVDGTDPDTDPTNDPTVTPLTASPDITLTKLSTYNDVNANGIVNAGDTITYNFTVVNTGNVTVSNIVINDPLLGVSNLAVSPATLAVGATGTASATYTITQADINAGSITNTATATGTAPDNSTVTDVSDNGDELVDGTDPDTDPTNDPTVTPLTASPDITLTKLSTYNDVNANGIVNAGDTITYNFTVVNTGNVTVSNIVINDPLLGVSNLAVSPATLAVGATGTASATYTITQADINAGSITNTATATGTAPDNSTVTDVSDNGDELVDGTDPDTDPTNDPTVTPLTASPDITLTKLSTYNDVNANGIVNAGDTITYNFTVVNTGNVTVSNIVINDPLLGVSNLAVSPSTLAVGASGTASATYLITQADINAGSITNTATATGTAPDNSTVTDVSDNGDELVDGTDPDTDPTNDPTVTVLPPSVSATQTFCFNSGATLSSITVLGQNVQWYSTSTGGTPLASNTILVNGATYYASQTINGVEGPRAAVHIVITPEVIISFEGGCNEDSYVITSNVSTTTQIATYVWTLNGTVVGGNSNTLNVTALNLDNFGTNEFVLTITTQEGCTFTDSFTPDSINCQIPNGVSPNGDGNNDTFILSHLDVKGVQIFNRYGMEIYSNDNYNDEWSGQAKDGKEVPDGTYYYIVHFKNGSQKAGWVYLLRK